MSIQVSYVFASILRCHAEVLSRALGHTDHSNAWKEGHMQAEILSELATSLYFHTDHATIHKVRQELLEIWWLA